MNNNDLYIIFQEALCDTLEKAAATEDEDVQRTGTKRLAAGGAAFGVQARTAVLTCPVVSVKTPPFNP